MENLLLFSYHKIPQKIRTCISSLKWVLMNIADANGTRGDLNDHYT